MPHVNALFFASSGNVFAIILNYFLGSLFYFKTKQRLKKSKTGRKSLLFGYRYGYLALLLSWLPIIGDPLTLVAGVLRLKFLYFILIAGVLRVGRYYFLTFMI
ncbi:DedA family protein [Sulfurimonas sp. SAG-AH-194-I05]|nr:DedA family protein [Sulfurimonas sp. SAG-AH-194-I05]